MEKNAGLIALDLDGTLLRERKEISARNRDALIATSNAGYEIVIATGRLYHAIPEELRRLPFIRYAIVINGACVLDTKENNVLYRAEIPANDAVNILSFLDAYPLIYDCYQDNWGYMTADMKESAAEYTSDAQTLELIRRFRKPVSELKEFLLEEKKGVQKLQFFTADADLRAGLAKELKAHFPSLSITSSLADNVEINAMVANKGDALLALLNKLEISRAAAIAFGDSSNDISMLRVAGLGIAMGNAGVETKAAANRVTASCDQDGVAVALEAILREKRTL